MPVGDWFVGLERAESGVDSGKGVSEPVVESVLLGGGSWVTIIRGLYEAETLALSEVCWTSVVIKGAALVVRLLLVLSTVVSSTLLAELNRRRNTNGVTGYRINKHHPKNAYQQTWTPKTLPRLVQKL